MNGCPCVSVWYPLPLLVVAIRVAGNSDACLVRA
jgi:hypothetical protein